MSYNYFFLFVLLLLRCTRVPLGVRQHTILRVSTAWLTRARRHIRDNPKHKDVAVRFDAIIAASVKTGELKRLREKFKKEYLAAIK